MASTQRLRKGWLGTLTGQADEAAPVLSGLLVYLLFVPTWEYFQEMYGLPIHI
jgi:hypothetical protein